MMEVEYDRIGHGEPVPFGWRLAGERPSHHGAHGVLIMRDVTIDMAAIDDYAGAVLSAPQTHATSW